MSNTAEIYKFPAPVPTQQECRMADLENGYLRLANQIQDALCIVELSGREFRVLNAIIRLTYGWSKKSDRIANSLIADKTTLKVKHVHCRRREPRADERLRGQRRDRRPNA